MVVLLGRLQRRQRRAIRVIAGAPARSTTSTVFCCGLLPGDRLNKLGAQATSVAAEKAATKSAKAVESAKLVAQALFESEAEREFKKAVSAGALSNRNDLKAFFHSTNLLGSRWRPTPAS